MKILITGGSGFIGRNLIEYLSQKHEILAPTHKELDLIDDAAVQDFFKKHTIDIVIHSAVKPGHRNANDTTNQLYINTRMFFNIVRNADRFQKMIFISSGAIYDMRHYVPKMKEEYFDNHVPIDEHGFSKYIIAKYIEQVENVVELRVFGIFGKYEDYAIRFISNAICKTLFNLPITIKQNRRFDYLYIDDLMPVIDYFLYNKGKYQCYNITPDYAIELRVLVEKVFQVSKKNLPILIAQNGMGTEYSGDNARLHEEIPEITFTPVDDAISNLFEWYKENIHLINKEYLLFDK
jgi:UDP-glucose 4-epimerase